MTLPRIFLAVSVVLFGSIGALALMKKNKSKKTETIVSQQVTNPAANQPIEIDLATLTMKSVQAEPVPDKKQVVQGVVAEAARVEVAKAEIPENDQIELLFQKNSPLRFVQTLQYKAKVPWKSGRSAWLVDYASHYKTHLHFIARSLNGRRDYSPKAPVEGQSFNVLATNIPFNFYLLIDLSRCRLWLYAQMQDTKEHILLKSYRVGLGRFESAKASGSLTPVGKYRLGSRIAIFQPKMMGNHKGKRVELITVFGTRWIPFEKEIEGCSEPAKGYGIHGTPWHLAKDGKLTDDTSSLGKYESDGCIRLATPDIEEIFAIVSTHDTIVEIVRDAKAPVCGK